MDAHDVERGAVLAMVGGAVFVPYALLKGRIARAIVDTGANLPWLSPESTAKLFHVAELLPFLLVAAGGLAVVRRARADLTPAGALGALVAAAGFVLVQAFHLGEHLLAPGRGPLPDVLVASMGWGYYGGWLVTLVGLALLGVGLRRTDTLPRPIPWLLVGLLPASVGLGLAVVALELFTFAGTQRLLLGLAWTAIGHRLWTAPAGQGDRPRPAPR